jgi:hypothetical protein
MNRPLHSSGPSRSEGIKIPLNCTSGGQPKISFKRSANSADCYRELESIGGVSAPGKFGRQASPLAVLKLLKIEDIDLNST